MGIPKSTFKYALPRAEDYLRIVAQNIIVNLQNGNGAKFNVSPLIERAYAIVNETGVIPYKDYSADTVFLKDVQP